MSFYRCGNSNCGNLIERQGSWGKKYCSNKCRQAAYRLRNAGQHRKRALTLKRYCVNCGKEFETVRVSQRFHSNSCRVSFHQQMKRLDNKESIEV